MNGTSPLCIGNIFVLKHFSLFHKEFTSMQNKNTKKGTVAFGGSKAASLGLAVAKFSGQSATG